MLGLLPVAMLEGRRGRASLEGQPVTEEEWRTCVDPAPMLRHLQRTASHRKLRLLTVAACRQIGHLLPPRCGAAVDVLERYADGLVGTDEYREAWGRADVESRMCAQDPPDRTTYAAESVMISSPPTATSVEYALSTAAIALGSPSDLTVAEQDYDSMLEAGRLRAAAEQARMAQCIFGNPFRPVAFDPRWRSADAVALAHGIYEDRAFDRLPLLADALMDAGCDDEQVMGHCRSDGPHVRGCWVLDLVLGKE